MNTPLDYIILRQNILDIGLVGGEENGKFLSQKLLTLSFTPLRRIATLLKAIDSWKETVEICKLDAEIIDAALELNSPEIAKKLLGWPLSHGFMKIFKIALDGLHHLLRLIYLQNLVGGNNAPLCVEMFEPFLVRVREREVFL